jgi:hypothetical protein
MVVRQEIHELILIAACFLEASHTDTQRESSTTLRSPLPGDLPCLLIAELAQQGKPSPSTALPPALGGEARYTRAILDSSLLSSSFMLWYDKLLANHSSFSFAKGFPASAVCSLPCFLSKASPMHQTLRNLHSKACEVAERRLYAGIPFSVFTSTSISFRFWPCVFGGVLD